MIDARGHRVIERSAAGTGEPRMLGEHDDASVDTLTAICAELYVELARKRVSRRSFGDACCAGCSPTLSAAKPCCSPYGSGYPPPETAVGKATPERSMQAY
jgi:hypothetical protein